MKQNWTIAQALVACALLKKESLTVEKLTLLVELLEPYGQEHVVDAIKKLMISCKFFPDISEIIEKITGNPLVEVEKASNRIWAIALNNSQYDMVNVTALAEETLSKSERDAVEIFGGWTRLMTVDQKEFPYLQKDIKKYLAAKRGIDLDATNLYLIEGGKQDQIS